MLRDRECDQREDRASREPEPTREPRYLAASRRARDRQRGPSSTKLRRMESIDRESSLGSQRLDAT
jgi:hypothetical protein